MDGATGCGRGRGAAPSLDRAPARERLGQGRRGRALPRRDRAGLRGRRSADRRPEQRSDPERDRGGRHPETHLTQAGEQWVPTGQQRDRRA